MSLESTIESKFFLGMKKLRVPTIKLTPQGSTGFPDRLIFITGGSPLFIEFKVLDGDLRAKQAHIRMLLQARGYNVRRYDNAEEAIEAVKSFEHIGSLGLTSP